MRTAPRRSTSFHIPGYSQNAALQLIVASGTGFILYKLVCVTLIVFGHTEPQSAALVDPYVALHPAKSFFSHFWTIFTYGWAYDGLMKWLSSMVWLYCFGNALQMLVSYKQVIPIFIYGLLGGGIFCLLCQLIPGGIFPAPSGAVLTGQAGIMALVAAIVTLSPNYRFYLGEHVSIPLLVVASIYVVLTMAFYREPAILMLDLGGLLTGFLTMTAIKKGMEPGAWIYNLGNRADRWATPANEQRFTANRKSKASHAHENIQKHIDEILDKINQRGYNSLTKEEKDLLVKASRDDK